MRQYAVGVNPEKYLARNVRFGHGVDIHGIPNFCLDSSTFVRIHRKQFFPDGIIIYPCLPVYT
jgi:hypothetical protein